MTKGMCAGGAKRKPPAEFHMTEVRPDSRILQKKALPPGITRIRVKIPQAEAPIFNYVRSFLDNEISREAFWALAKFKHPTHQICFHTEAALRSIRFIGAEECHAPT